MTSICSFEFVSNFTNVIMIIYIMSYVIENISYNTYSRIQNKFSQVFEYFREPVYLVHSEHSIFKGNGCLTVANETRFQAICPNITGSIFG